MLGNFMLCFNGIMPLMLLMLSGYLLCRLKVIPREGFAQVDMLCYKFFIPFILFYSTRNADFSTGVDPLCMVYAALATVAQYLISYFLIRKRLPPDEAVTLIHCWSQGNLAVIGIPLITNIFGSETASIFSLYMVVVNLIINALMIVCHNKFKGQKIPLGELALRVLRSPYIVGSLVGLAFSITGIRFPVFVESTMDSLYSIASPLALFSLGASFRFGEARQYRKHIAATFIVKCIIMPVVFMLPLVLLGVRDLSLLSMLIIFTCPTAVATYTMSVGIYGKPALGAQLVVFTTLFSMFIIFAWLFAFLQLGFVSA